jgi:hypothetical protein
VTRGPLSSTALIEKGTVRRGHAIGSAATSAEAVPGVYTVSLSGETPRMLPFGAPLAFPPTERQGVLVAEDMLQHYAQHPVYRAIDLVISQPNFLVSFHTLTFPATTTGNILVLRPAVMPISGLPAMLSSTDPELGASRVIRRQFAEAVGLAADEWFEDGVESRFSRGLSALLDAYSDGAIAALEAFVGSPGTNVEVAVEAAKWLGGVDHATTKVYRRTLLEKMLNSPAVRLRHGAAAGLASMDDPGSIDALRAALGRESNSRLRNYLQLVVNQLEPTTTACPSRS